MTFGLARKAFGATLIALLAMASPARAAIDIYYRVNADTPSDGTTGVLGPLGDNVAVTGTLGNGNQSVRYNITSNATESPTLGTLSTTTFTLNNSTNQTRNIEILVSALGYTLPSPTATLSSSASGTSASSESGQTATLQSYADAGNRGFFSFDLASMTTTGAQTGVADAAPPGTATYVFSPAEANTSFAQDGLYSLTQRILVTLAAGRRASLTLSTNVTAGNPVPEPATVVTALSALPALGIYLARRRRQKA